MASATWPAALSFVWRPENDGQGYHCDAGDPGGATNRGVTHATWDEAVRHGLVSGDLSTASPADLSRVLRCMFWNVIQGDALPAGPDLAVFNIAMLAGPGRAARILQGVCGAVVDGAVGPATIRAAGGMPASGLVARLTDGAETYFAHCSDAAQFLRGWTRRANDCRALAISIVNATPEAA